MEDNILAGATPPDQTHPVPTEAREIFPVKFDKDYMDFRPERTDDEVNEVPKGWSAQASVTSPPSVTPGLEDVSTDDWGESAQVPVEKDKLRMITTQPDNGKLTSSEATSPGKSEQLAKM